MCNPVDDLVSFVSREAHNYRENPLLVPAEQKEMFEKAAKKATEAGIYVPLIKAVWRKETKQ